MQSTDRLDTKQGRFPSTSWALVLKAKSATNQSERTELEALCRLYWRPIYSFVRRRGYNTHDAQDLTQSFFADLLSRDWLEGIEPSLGRFRTFLLRCVTNFLNKQHRKELSFRRSPLGGLVPLDLTAEDLLPADPSSGISPETVFDRAWVTELISQTKRNLQSEYQAAGRSAQYELFAACLTERAEHGSITDLAERIGLSEGATRVALHRFRERFGHLLRQVVAQTVRDPADVDKEIRELFGAWKA